MKKYIAEALGTGVLTLTVLLSLTGHFPIPTPLLAGLVVGLFVYTIGHISGTHLNPAVTVGLWSIDKIKTDEAFWYVVSQFVGAGVAMVLVSSLGIATSALFVSNSLLVGIAEVFGTFFFTFGIASVVYGKTPSALSGVVIGSSLVLGIAIAALLGSNGVLNPAVAFGIGSCGVMYLLAPVIGSILGMHAYKNLAR